MKLLEDLRTWEELTPDEQWETLAKFELKGGGKSKPEACATEKEKECK